MNKLSKFMVAFFVFVLCLSGCGGEAEISKSVDNKADLKEEIMVDEEVFQYFDEATVNKISSIPNVYNLNITTTEFDEYTGEQPIFVLFFSVNLVEDVEDDINDYVDRVNAGGCIEVYPDDVAALSRNAYLLGYYLFDFTGGKHSAVNNYVLQTSKELSSSEQENLLTQLTEILKTAAIYNEIQDNGKDESANIVKIEIGINHNEFIDMNCSDIVSVLKEKGFINIVENPEVIEFDISKESKCTEITIDGSNEFSSTDLFGFDEEIVITYYKGALASAPDNWTNLVEKHYEDVEKQFKDAGFINITCVPQEIDYDETKVFEGSVVNIAIGDNATFDIADEFYTVVPVRIDYRVKPEPIPEPEPMPEPTPQPTPEPSTPPSSESSGGNGNSSSGSSGGSGVTVPDHAETGNNLVWVPTNGGTKYHSKSSCSKMKDPIQVSLDTAIANGYTACKRCH